MTRAVVADFTFSNGTTVPKGAYGEFWVQQKKVKVSEAVTNHVQVLAPIFAMYLDEDLFPTGSTFDAFRWSRLRSQPGNENRYQFVSTSPTHINFGHGKVACPGRFFAAQEIKLSLAHILLQYEVRMKDGVVPKETWYDRSRRPDQRAEVEFRVRKE
jgi:cytochrome P450